MNIYHLVRNNIIKLEAYQSARKIGGIGNIWLNANEIPYSDNWKLNINLLNRYPPIQPSKLINKYAKYSGVQPNQILVSRGADEGIELLMKTFCEPNKDTILFCTPTYGMYKICAEIFGIKYITIPFTSHWQLNLSKINLQLHKIKLIYICNPNNPTGNIINLNDIKKLLRIINYRSILIIDEAYIDFCLHNSIVTWISEFSNLVVLRTLSKAFALAGLRCGFTIAHNTIIQILSKIITPYPLPMPVINIAEKAFTDKNIQKTYNRIKIINYNRNVLMKKLIKCPCIQQVFPSVSNYLLVKVNPKYQVFQKLWNQGIILRDQSKQIGLSNCLRITIGTYKECKHLIHALQQLNKESN